MMGISADIIQINEDLNHITDIANFSDTKIIAYIGSGHAFHKSVMENYEENIGCFTLKDGWKHIKEEEQKRIINYLEGKYNTKFEYLFEKPNWYITLNY